MTVLSAVTSALSLLLAASALPAQTADTASAQAGVSKVRIVRLSEVKGAVQVDLARGQGYEAAMANLPIVEQTRLRTDEGVAEIELEDNSTIRLTPDSEVDFPRLERTAAGATLSTLHVISGTVYVSLLKSKENQFTVLFGREKLDLTPGSHVRLDVGALEGNVAMLDGEGQLTDATGTIEIPHKKTVSFVWSDPGKPDLRKDIAEESWDGWDKDATGYHARVASSSAFGSSPYAYGMNDMMYYGSFMNAGGCGMMWRPYFASAAWDPYANGAWAYYQGAGYSWVSPYPWGWMPYHSGSWAFCPGTGWGWQPGGGGWYGLNNAAAIASTTRTGGAILPHPPTAPPRAGHPIILPVNAHPMVVSQIDPRSSSFVFRRDSAGMGIPREGLGKLNGFSRHSISHGSATTQIYVSGVSARPMQPGMGRAGGMNTFRPTNTMANMGAIHRGIAPASMPSMGAGRGMSGGGFHGASNVSAGPSMSAAPSSMGARGGGGGGGGVVAARGH